MNTLNCTNAWHHDLGNKSIYCPSCHAATFGPGDPSRDVYIDPAGIVRALRDIKAGELVYLGPDPDRLANALQSPTPQEDTLEQDEPRTDQ